MARFVRPGGKFIRPKVAYTVPNKQKKKTTNKTTTPEHLSSTDQVAQDARELLSSNMEQETNFPKFVIGDDSTSTKTTVITKQKPEIKLETTRAAQTATTNSVMATQTDFATNNNDDTREACVSRVDFNACINE